MSKPSEQQTNHGQIDPRLAGRTEPFIILAPSTVVGQLGEAALHDPPPQDDMGLRCGQILRTVELLRWDVVGRPGARVTMDRLDHLNTPAACLFDPILAVAFAIVVGIQPDMA